MDLRARERRVADFRAIDGDPRLDGLIDEIRIYGRALSLAEIQADMAAPL